MAEEITPQLLLNAYRQGWFPMAQAEDDPELYWYNPERRGIMPLDGRFHLSRSNKRLMRQHKYRISLNTAFTQVMQACRENRDGCWISDRIIALYTQLHQQGHAHSLEVWDDTALIGGIYGISIGKAFCGESMFSRQSGASKVALIALVNHLRAAHYQLFDVQYVNEHLTQFGVQEVPQAAYLTLLNQAIGHINSPLA